MARIKYILNERRIAAREAQDLIKAAGKNGGDSTQASPTKRAPANFMEAEAPGTSTSQAVS